jgi:hypothetical protein
MLVSRRSAARHARRYARIGANTFVHPSAVDGLVVVSNILGSVVGVESLRSFCDKVGVPVVSIGELPGFPEVSIESTEGSGATLPST